MISGIVSCPNPPLLLRGITGQPVAEVEALRTACLAALADLLAGSPDRVLIIGGTDPVPAGNRRPAADTGKPLSITVGRLLLSQAGCAVPIEQLTVAADATAEACLTLGRSTPNGISRPEFPRHAEGAENSGRRMASTALLVMADGSARRGLKAPGYLDSRAQSFDSAVESALASGDPAGLAALDPVLAAELLVSGRAAWQVLAGATEGRRFTPRMYYSDDPFGVWYPVTGWRPL